MYHSCYSTLSSKIAFSQAESRQHKRENNKIRNNEDNDNASRGGVFSSTTRLGSVIAQYKCISTQRRSMCLVYGMSI